MTLSKFTTLILCSISLTPLIANEAETQNPIEAVQPAALEESPAETLAEIVEPLQEETPLHLPREASEEAAQPMAIELSPQEPEAAEPLQTPEVQIAASQPKRYVPRPYIEEKFGYFFFTSAPMNQIYNQGGIDLQLSGLYPLCSYLGLYASVEYLQKSGHSLNGHQRTTFWEVPLSLGLQPSIPLKSDRSVIYYVTVGPRYVFAGIRNHSSFVPRTGHANNIGGFINTGFMVNAYKELKLDFFTEYSFVRLKFHTSRRNVEAHSVQGGGVVFGGGLIYKF